MVVFEPLLLYNLCELYFRTGTFRKTPKKSKMDPLWGAKICILHYSLYSCLFKIVTNVMICLVVPEILVILIMNFPHLWVSNLYRIDSLRSRLQIFSSGLYSTPATRFIVFHNFRIFVNSRPPYLRSYKAINVIHLLVVKIKILWVL